MAETKLNHQVFHFSSGIAILLLFLLLPQKAFNQDYNFRHYHSEDGLPQPFIYSLIQDSKGYLWIGTGDGLARFNGFEFENFTTVDSLAENFITSSISMGNTLWFGHMNGKLTHYDGEKFKPVTIPNPNQSPITGMVKSPDGTIWVSTYADGLVSINNENIKHFPFKEPIIVKCIGIIGNYELLLGTNAGVIHCQIKNNTAEVKILSEIPETRVASIKKTKNGSFLVATEEDGIFQVTAGNKISVTRIVIPPQITGIQDIHQDQQNNLWICTFGNGIVKLSQSKGVYSNPVYFNNTTGFVTDNTKLFFEDREGSLWIGHFGDGLTQITPKTFFTSHDERNIISLYFNQQYKWLGTESGLIKTDPVTSETLLHYKGKGLPEDKINSLYSPDDKELWIGTEKNGLFRLNMKTDQLLKHPLTEDVLSNSINIITGKGDNVWIGTKKGLCHIDLKTKRTSWYSLNKGGLPHNYVNTVFIDSRNRVWVGTRSSILACIENQKVNKINLNTGGGNFELSAITEDSNTRIWAGSLGKGVFVIDKTDSIANLTSKEGLYSDYCYSMVNDKSTIWVGHKGGLSRIAKSFSVKPVEQLDDQPVNYQFNMNAVYKDPSRSIWFGTDKGLIQYNPANESQEPVPPLLSITSVKINDEPLNFRKDIVLPSGNYKIKIEYIGISLKQPAMVTYQYKLDGYEQWSEVTKNTSVTFNHLSEGNYTFILKASDGDGTVTQTPLSLSIRIKKPAWKQWWFYPSSFFLLLLFAFFYLKRHEYRFQEEKRILEEKVSERTAEIQTQKTEIERQRDFIEAKNYQITSSITYASHIQNAVLPSADLIQKLFPNHFLLSKPKDIVSGDFFWVAEKESNIIFTVADCTGHGVPGAFMSLLGITILNEIVNIHGIVNASEIVSRLRARIIESLQQNKGNRIMSDGMDMTLCVLDRKAQMLHVVGAKQDLLIIRNGKTEVVKADRFSVNAEYDSYEEFTCKTADVKPGDMLYLFTDGFKDQFGGTLDKKYMVKRFYKTLLEIHHLPMDQQKQELENRLIHWMGSNEQTDDITVMGIKI